jgi:uncharacterized C2H2 Zn-finger protein
MAEDLKCDKCAAILEPISARDPWTEEHWQCPACDSTYKEESKDNTDKRRDKD